MKYIIANWKMNMDSQNIFTWVEDFSMDKNVNKKIIIAPAFLHIPLIQQFKDSLNIDIGAQDVSFFEKGSHTGDIGAFQLKYFCKYCIVGHSERKENFEEVIKKRNICLKHNITPIVCFTNPKKASKYINESIILAWEDPDNISKNGQFRPKNPNDIQKGIDIIRKQIPNEIPLVYGGSVNRQNIKDLVNINKLDGILVGSASLDAAHFQELINAF